MCESKLHEVSNQKPHQISCFKHTLFLVTTADSDQLGDVLHWLRQATSVFCGVVCGAIPLTGAIWLLVFLVLSTGIVYGYYTLILKVDEEEFGGHGTLLQEGLFASVTLFLLAWILVYSLIHF
ncbi:unnamed protein product [Sphagnum troendelagicum]|uniref:Rab5-interacting protein n=1 Tax=Sphagnum troendelagicum TaxID=128251 RepID=A0ABP0TEM6_9BRYO